MSFPKRHSGFQKKDEPATHHRIVERNSGSSIELYHKKFGYDHITKSYNPMVLNNPLWYKKKYGEAAWKKAVAQINKTKREE
jgi:hypothetical protein